MNYKRKPTALKTTVVHYEPVPMETLIGTLMSPTFEQWYNRQPNEIVELTLHPYVMETDLWSIQLYHLSRSWDWDLLRPHEQHAWLRKIKALPGV